MTIGRTISIYLPDANPQGIKICDFLDSIVKAVSIPRAKLSDASQNQELTQPGVYFLIGEKDELGKPSIYVGESEVLLTRLNKHNKEKDFWNQAICFVSEKNNLNKAHIKYLENHACNEAKKVNKCTLENSNNPTQSSLTNQDRDFVLRIFEDLKIIMTTLGYPIFEQSKKRSKINVYYCKSKDADAVGEYTEEGFVVNKGSKSNIEETPSIQKSIKTFRANLVGKGILKEENDVYVFQEDFTFSSPSMSASVVLGRTANGWREWKDKGGKTLDAIIRKGNVEEE
ncbi:GIY-YIG nuclease family protein [Methanococcoides seepicolus]|uniref:GIY-YIG nuclease family protein n=1 Tax=Methanococcoides seepicolus TaxID=2828780 RepID=A0A9E4ZHW3_9EURY|nr:GIY-YIG nuclease family protein [Methanococcoides seepicolus]MCM1987931.1 GIY-YIG nuclease family protein [Methanococcoides seepicolus]